MLFPSGRNFLSEIRLWVLFLCILSLTKAQEFLNLLLTLMSKFLMSAAMCGISVLISLL